MHPHPDQRDDAGFSFSPVRSLLVMALMGALLAVAPSSASAQTPTTPEAEQTTSVSACVDDAVEQTIAFTDIAELDSARQDAINCLAYYGITVGKTVEPPTYDPSGNVTRGQMALFLYRAAQVAGVNFTPDADDKAARFSDISELGDAWQEAIKALYAKEIMTGRGTGDHAAPGASSSTSFVPHEPINRAEMAVYLRNLVRVASPDLFDDYGDLKGVTTLDAFPDARTGTPGPVSDAISQAYELGITTGRTTSPAAYDPEGDVTRSQMALFITRALAHTSARPFGLTAQKVEGEWSVVVSVRDRKFMPADSARVDIFVADPAALVDDDGDDVSIFGRGGSCDPDVVRVPERDEFMFGYGYDLCEIDDGDEETTNGDVTFDLSHESTAKGLVAWVWTGDDYDELGDIDDAVRVEFAKGDQPPPAPTELTVAVAGCETDMCPTIPLSKMPKTRVRVQLKGSYANDRDNLVDAPAPAGTEYTVSRTFEPTEGVVWVFPDETITLRSNGSYTLPLVEQRTTVADGTLTLEFAPADDEPDLPTATVAVEISDDEPMVTTVTAVARRGAWHPVDTQVGDARTDIVVTVRDQYGNPMSGADATVRLSGDSVDLPDPVPDPDNRNQHIKNQQDGLAPTKGSSLFRLDRKVLADTGFPAEGDDERANGFVEKVTAWVDTHDGDNGAPEAEYTDDDADADVVIYWAADEPNPNSGMGFNVVGVDPRNDQIIVHKQGDSNDDEVYVMSYADASSDSDRFYVDPADGRRDVVSDLGAFEAALRRVLAGQAEYTLDWDKTASRSWEFTLTSNDMS